MKNNKIMKVYVCPVCDHVLRGWHYCRICHSFVKKPYYIDQNYSMDRISAEPNMPREQKRDQDNHTKEKAPKKQGGNGKKEKRRFSVIWKIFIIYVLFQIAMAIGSAVLANLPEGFFERRGTHNTEDFTGVSELPIDDETQSGWNYEELDYDRIMEEGEECTGHLHFDIDGQEFLGELQQKLSDADFEVVNEEEAMQNYLAESKEDGETVTFYETYRTFYLSGDYSEYYRQMQDTVSGRLINTEIASGDYDRVYYYIISAVDILLQDSENEKRRTKDTVDRLLEKLAGGESEEYFSETIGDIVVSGYVDTYQETTSYHVALSK